MKKIIMFLAIITVAFFGINTVSAEEIDLDTIQPNTYIIGERVYELNKHKLTIFDIVNAQAEYSNEYGQVAPILYLGVDLISGDKYVSVTTGPDTFEDKEVDDVFPHGKVEVSSVNNKPIDTVMPLSNIKMLVGGAVNELNNTAVNYGFNSIAFDYEKNIITFDIYDLKAKLADFKDSGIVDLFLLNVEGINNITYELGDVTKNVTYAEMDTSSEVISLAKELLAYLAGDADTLNYAAIAGKEISATVSFSEFGLTYTDTYTVKFTYNMDEFLMRKDSDILNATSDLSNEISQTEGGFGLAGVFKNENIITFDIINLDAKLADYKESSIVDIFLKNTEFVDKITYKIGDFNKTVNLPEDADTTTEVVALAKELLAHLAGDANTLDFRSVANKSVEATITYKVGAYKEEIPYTLKFTYDIEMLAALHEGAIMDAANKLNGETALYEAGFNSVAYNFENKTVTFEVHDLKAKLSKYKESSIVDLFLKNSKDVESITYTIGSFTKVVNLPEDADTTTEVVALAKELLAHLAGDANALDLGSVANKKVTATVKYALGKESKEVDYVLEFTYDVSRHVEEQDLAIEEGINSLNIEDSGFSWVTYNRENRIVEFKIGDGSVKLATFKNSGIVDLFLNNIEYASKITYKLGETDKEVNLPEDADTTSEVIALAKEILVYLASESDTLNLDAVDGDSITAVVTYDVNGKTQNVDYTISFTK